MIVRNPLILRTEAASSSASSAASSAASSVNLAVDQTVEMKDRTKVKKLPIYKRPVNCLDAAEEESNYDTNIELPEPPISLSSKFKVRSATNLFVEVLWNLMFCLSILGNYDII